MINNDFKCPCCNVACMDPNFQTQLYQAEKHSGIPFTINSGFRCPAHNKEIGGSPTSSHLKGLAADISATNSWERYYVLSALISAGFTRIGIAKTYIHVDADAAKPGPVVWLYNA